MTARNYQLAASASLIALIFLGLGWELWWAPIKPGGSWLVLKSIVLLAPLFGILRGKRSTYKWTSLLVQFYLLEGLVRATSDSGIAQRLAIVETMLATILFVSVILYIRATRTPDIEKAASAS